MPKELVGVGNWSIPDSYKNPLDQEALVKLFGALQEAFQIAAEGGIGDSKWGDNDEADSISHLISVTWQKYQDNASFKQRSEWQAAEDVIRRKYR